VAIDTVSIFQKAGQFPENLSAVSH